MAERQRTEISEELLDRLRAEAEVQGRDVSELLDEAVIGYLSFLYARGELAAPRSEQDPAVVAVRARLFRSPGTGRPDDPSTWHPRTSSELFALVHGWQRANGVEAPSDEEAMRLAVEEQQATRDEREARR